jgi:hypothetical protein
MVDSICDPLEFSLDSFLVSNDLVVESFSISSGIVSNWRMNIAC